MGTEVREFHPDPRKENFRRTTGEYRTVVDYTPVDLSRGLRPGDKVLREEREVSSCMSLIGQYLLDRLF